MTAITEKERLEILTQVFDKSSHELQQIVDSLLDKITSGSASELDKNRASVVASIILRRG